MAGAVRIGGTDIRLIAPAVGAWLGAWITAGLPDIAVSPMPMVVGCWLVTAALLLGTLIFRHARVVNPMTVVAVLTLTAAALSATSAQTALTIRTESPLAELARNRGVADFQIELASSPSPVSHGQASNIRTSDWQQTVPTTQWRVVGAAVSMSGRSLSRVAVRMVAEFVADIDVKTLSFGSRIAVTARAVTQPAQDRNGFKLIAQEPVAIVEPPPIYIAWAIPLRQKFSSTARTLAGDGGALLPGLAVGDVSAVDDDLDSAMKASSLSHLTAVSGSNCILITAAAFGIAALCRAGRWLRVCIALIALAAFVVLVTPQASVVRAAFMATVVLVTLAWGRPSGGTSALALATILLLVIDPWYARDYGFLLSVAATAGLLLLAPKLVRKLALFMPRPIALVIAVPLAAQLACQPVLILLEPTIPTYGVVANILVEPAAPAATVIGVLGCLTLQVLPSVGHALLQIAWWPASWIALVARGAEQLPGSRIPWISDGTGMALLAVATAAGLWIFLARRRRSWLVLVTTTAITVSTSVPIGINLGSPIVGSFTRPTEWDVAMCDVGQGDASLIRSNDQFILIDTGNEPAALKRCLHLLGVDRIDLLIATHWDADHVAAAPVLAGMVDAVIHGPLDGERSDRVLDPLIAGGAKAREVTQGWFGDMGDIRWRVLWPRPRATPGNSASLAISIEAFSYRALFLGDLDEESQQRLRRSVTLGQYDLVKVAHHGSADQSSELYQAIAAQIALIGVGADNGYGHPTAKTLGFLADFGVTVLRTDADGTLLVDWNTDTAEAAGSWSKRLRIWTERGGGFS